jgi:hypothetical protein
MMLLTPAAALAAVLPPDEHIVDGAIQRHLDGRIEVVIGNGERAIDAALCARLQPWIFDLLVLPLPARLIGLRFARRRGDPVAVGALGGTVIAVRELVDPLRAALVSVKSAPRA